MRKKIAPAFKNFYVITGTIFLVWMLFLDTNNFISVYGLSSKLRSLQHEKEYYQNKKEEVMKDYNELFGNKRTLQKFAREKYLMKKDTEDVFIIVEED